MFRWRRRNHLIIHDPDREREERRERAEAEFEALLDRIWGPEPTVIPVKLTKPVASSSAPSESTWRDRLIEKP